MRRSREPDTDDLIRLTRQGDPSARDRLLARHRPRLRQMVRLHLDRRLGARVDPSDVVQETLAEAARRLEEYLHHPPLPFYPWLRQIALDRLLDLRRRHLRARKRSVAREEPDVLALPDESAAELAAPTDRPGQQPEPAPAARRAAGAGARRWSSCPRATGKCWCCGTWSRCRPGRSPPCWAWGRGRCGCGSSAPGAAPRPAGPEPGGTAMNHSAAIPGQRQSFSDSFALLVEELTEKLQAGEPIDVDALLQAHPEDAEPLRRLLPALFLLAEVSGSKGGPAPAGGGGELGDAGRLPDRPRGRPRRHGHRLRGGADVAGPAGGAEGAAVRGHDGPAAIAALPERGPGGGRACTTRTSCRSTRSAASAASTSTPCSSSTGRASPS